MDASDRGEDYTASMALSYTVRFGEGEGIKLRPHRYKKGYKASKSKYGPHRWVAVEAELISYLRRGWSICMSGPGHSPSLITPNSVVGWREF